MEIQNSVNHFIHYKLKDLAGVSKHFANEVSALISL
jgi:hypothetical protein